MKFSPKHDDNIMRAIYGALVVFSVAFSNIGSGLTHTIFMCLTVVCLCTGLFLFMRHEMTTYTYIAMENDGGLDFYVDKAMGKRSSYVCYYPLKDCVALEKYEKGTKKELCKRLGKTFFYRYSHNVFTKDKYIIVFQNEGHCDAVICQLDTPNYEYLKNAISLSREKEKEKEEAIAE